WNGKFKSPAGRRKSEMGERAPRGVATGFADRGPECARKFLLAPGFRLVQCARVLGGTAALHSHSTVGGCTFFAFYQAAGGSWERAERNSGLCHPQRWQRHGLRHLPITTPIHAKIQRPAVISIRRK